MGNPDRLSRNGKNVAPGCAQLHQFGTFPTRRDLRDYVSGAVALAITLKSRRPTQC